jgi:hypothetical protein
MDQIRLYSLQKALAAAVVLCCTAAVTPAFAGQPDDRGSTPGLGWGAGGSNKGVPGPIAGAGLPFLVLAGAYVLVRRRRNRNRDE